MVVRRCWLRWKLSNAEVALAWLEQPFARNSGKFLPPKQAYVTKAPGAGPTCCPLGLDDDGNSGSCQNLQGTRACIRLNVPGSESSLWKAAC